MPFHWHIIGICILGNSVEHIQMTINLLISIEKIQFFFLFLNSSSECVLSKMFSKRLKIQYRSKVIVEMVTVGHFSTHFLSNYSSWITSHQCPFYPKFELQMIDLAILEKYFHAKFMRKTLDIYFYAPPSAHNWNPYFR